MDPDIEIMHSVGSYGLKPKDLVHVNISSQFNRLKPPKSKTGGISDESVESTWNNRILENPKLYNDTKFRVHSICQPTYDKDKVEINVGVTDYKTYLGTNWAENVKELQLLGIRLYDNTQAFLSEPLGVGSFLILSDNNFVLLKRNVHCAEAPGMWDVPGGHAEPKKIVGNLPLDKINASEMVGDDVRTEIFESILQEIVDEVNIPTSNLENPLYMGTARNNTGGGRPSLEFVIRCSLSSEEVHSNYSTGSQLEADESTSIKFVPVDKIRNLQRSDKELWTSLAPSAKGCIILYQMAHGMHQEGN